MSNRRRPERINLYRTEYLRSRAWFARRDQWFRDHSISKLPLACAACGRVATKRHLELHHLDYSGMHVRDGVWYALEDHTDLVPMHPYCHELLHRLIDSDVVLSHHRTRRDASEIALDRLRDKLTPTREPA